MVSLADFLGYEFDKAQIEREVYFPKGHAAVDADKEIIRRGFAKLMSGEMALPLDVRSMAVDEDMRRQDHEVRSLLQAWLTLQIQGQRPPPGGGESKPES